MKRVIYVIFALCMFSTINAQEEIVPYETGSGARAFALANNQTALSTGISDLYWNPAALSFSVSREFQASLYGMKLASATDYFGKSSDDRLLRPGLGNVGFSFALPASRGGMTIAGSYSNPIILDDAYTFSGQYNLDDAMVTVNDRISKTTGNLNFWTIGFGLQIAKNFGAGIAASLISGKHSADLFLDQYTEGPESSYSTYDDYISEGSYLGYDIRAGLFYKMDRLQTGVRLVLPRAIRYNYQSNGTYDNDYFDIREKITMYSSYSGAWGISTTLPYFTLTGEVRSTLPYDVLFPIEEIPDDCQAAYFKSGGGIGIEVPVVAFPAIVRVGYSCDELDLHPWVYDYNYGSTIDIEWSDYGMNVSRKLHKISCGIGFTTATTAFDVSYGFSTWGITTNRNREQTYYLHRILTSFAVRF